MEEVTEQLKEEVYSMAKEKLALETKMRAIDSYLGTLKKELEYRTPSQF